MVTPADTQTQYCNDKHSCPTELLHGILLIGIRPRFEKKLRSDYFFIVPDKI
jgi:hypothetical protein